MYIINVSLGVVSAWCCLSSPILFIFSAPFPSFPCVHGWAVGKSTLSRKADRMPSEKTPKAQPSWLSWKHKINYHTKSHLTEETERKTSLCTEAELNRMDFNRALAKPWCPFVVRSILAATCGVNWNPSDFCKQLVCLTDMCTLYTDLKSMVPE